MQTKNVLIDTCIWKKLVNKLEFDSRLKLLEYWLERDYIQLITPPTLAKEWKAHREKERQLVMKVVREHGKDVKKALLLEYDIPEVKLERADKLLLAQIDLIDKLFRDSAHIEESSEAVLKTHHHKTNGRAPFHNNPKSDKDALIILSVLDYLHVNGFNELYFLSENCNDFGNPLDFNTTIHPDISSAYPSVTIHYFKEVEQGFQQLKKTGLPTPAQTGLLSSHQVRNIIKIDRTLPFLDQLNEYIKKRFIEIPIFPRHLFTEQYPFLTGNNYLPTRRAFTINTDNKNFYDLINGCKVVEGELHIEYPVLYENVADYENKIRKVLRTLAHNNVRDVITGDQKETHVIYSDGFSCFCAMCNYSRLAFPESFEIADASEGDIPERFKKAYTLYKLGVFFEAARRFKALAEECDKQGLSLLCYIARFNFHRLVIICRNQFYGEAKQLQLVEDLGIVDLDDELTLADSAENRAILDWIHSNKFITEPLSSIHQVVGAIRIDFHSKNSGWNENAYTLLDIYEGAENFLNANFLVFDKSAQFESLADLYLEGLFASHGCHPKLGGRLNYFTDDILNSLLHYCKAERIRHYFSRYSLKGLLYKPTSSKGSFVETVCRIMDEYVSTSRQVDEHELIDTHFFWEEYTQKVFNGITLCALLSLESDGINSVAQSILTFIRSNMKGYHFHEFVKCVSVFLTRKAKKLNPNTVYKFLRLPLVEEQFLDAQYLNAIEEVLRSGGLHIHFTEQDFDLFREKFLQSPQLKKTYSIHFINTLFFYTDNEPHKASIKFFIVQELEVKFDPHLYYSALIRDIVPIDKSLFQKYKHFIGERLRGKKIQSFHYTPDYYVDPVIDEFINCWFKFGFELDDEIKNKILSLGEYYRWILDIDGFDYSLFRPEWIWNHFTKYYKQKFRQSEILRSEILRQIEPPYDSKLLRHFIEIYSREPKPLK